MKTLHVIVSNKVATYLQRDGYIVCGNSDYQVEFTFSSEWDAYERKTARFIWRGKPVDVEFSGNVCPVPIVANTEELKVGVYVENLSTTTSAVIPCRRSVLCDSETEAEGKVVVPEGTPVLGEATITENGEHYPAEGYDGFYKVTVKVVAEPEEVKLQEKTATENGEVVADSGYDGLSKVTVAVEGETVDIWDGTGVVIAPIEEEPTTFTFTIDGTEYTADSGMTWYEWVSSDYAPDSYSCESTESKVYPTGDTYVTDSEGNAVIGSTVIAEGGVYSIEAAEDALAGTWVFNDRLSITTNIQWSFNFLSNDTEMASIRLNKLGDNNALYYVGTDTLKAYEYVKMTSAYTWTEDAYKTITITSNLADVTDGGTLLTWLKANATKQ